MALATQLKLGEAQKALHDLFSDPTTPENDFDCVMRFLNDRPEYAPVHEVLPVHEVEEKLEIVQRLQDQLWADAGAENEEAKEETRLTRMQLSILMAIPLANLRHCAAEYLDVHLGPIHHFVRIVLQKGKAQFAPPPGHTSSEDSDFEDTSGGKTKVNRSRTETDKALQRDLCVCVVQKSASADGAHVVPFASNSTARNLAEIQQTRGARILLEGEDARAHYGLLCRMGGTDFSWNIIAMNKQLHKYWSEGRFALRCLGITPRGGGISAVEIQFFWMPTHTPPTSDDARTSHWRVKINIETEGKAFVLDWARTLAARYPQRVTPAGVSAADARSYRPIHTGRVFRIELPHDDAKKMRSMLQLQWAAIQIARMSGAAESADFLNQPPPPVGDDWILNWVLDAAGNQGLSP